MLWHYDPSETCTICGHVSPNKRALRSHIKSAHSEPTFKCSICEKKFKKATILKVEVYSLQKIINYNNLIKNFRNIWPCTPVKLISINAIIVLKHFDQTQTCMLIENVLIQRNIKRIIFFTNAVTVPKRFDRMKTCIRTENVLIQVIIRQI